MPGKADALRIALAQLNPTVGDIRRKSGAGRAEARADAAEQGADLIVFSELFLTGYPPEDLVLKPAFIGRGAGRGEELRGRDRRRRAGRAGRHALGARRQAA